MVGRSGLVAFSSVAVAALLSCGGEDLVLPSDSDPGAITLVTGNGQSGPAGAELGDALVVKVLDRRGAPLSNQRVAFALGSEVPGARVNPDTTETNTAGLAEARWVLGSTVGTQTVVASVVGMNGLEVTFTASVGAGGATTIERAGGDDQSARVGSALGNELVVRVLDGFGNPVAGVTVEWSAGQGSVDPISTVTGDDGRAATSWTLGMTVGGQTATASSPGLAPVEFTATALSGDASSLVRVSGNNQTGRAGTELSEPLEVRLTDEDGNGVPGQPVSWVIATGGGSVSSANTLTGPDGIASTRWTLGPNPGGNTLNAVASGIGVVPFSATATGGGGGGGGGGSSASRLAFVVQPSDVEQDRRIEPPVRVAVLDDDGNVVTQGSFEIKLEVVGGDDDADLRGKDKKNTESGIATFDDIKVDREGHYRLRASTGGLPSADSNEFEVEED